jgi:uncharacterized protein YbbC (DUF1343 family)
MPFEKIGALWIKDGKKGKYMGGEMELDGVKRKVMVFKNNYKKTDAQPDYIINMAVDDEQQQDRSAPEPSRYTGPSVAGGGFEDDIDF